MVVTLPLMSEGTGDRLAILAGLTSIFLVLTIIATYFVPAIIAGLRRHRNWVEVFVVNLLFGWTLVGWVAALVWSLYRERPSSEALARAENH